MKKNIALITLATTIAISILIWGYKEANKPRTDVVTQYSADGKIINKYVGRVTYSGDGKCIVEINNSRVDVTGTYKIEYGK